MTNVTIPALPPVTLPIDGPNTLLEVSVLEAGVPVSRKITADDLGAVGTIAIEDEGVPLVTEADTLNFVGAGVVASGAGSTKTITIPGGGGGNVLSTGTPVNNQLAVWTDSITIEGDANLTYDGTTLNIGTAGSNPSIIRTGVSTTTPGFIPNQVDPDTGLGADGADVLSMIAGGLQALMLFEQSNGAIQIPRTTTGITAFSGGGQGSAVALINSYNVIGTVAAPGDSVRLPSAFFAGSIIFIKNDGANAADIFPASGDDLGQGTNVARSLAAGESVEYIATAVSSTWTELIDGGTAYFGLTATDRVVGSNAGSSNSGDNVFLANALAGDVNIADNVIAIGSSALAVAAQLDFDGTIAIGQNAGALLTDTRDPWVIIGKDAAANMPGAAFHDGNTVIGTEALLNNTSTNMQGVTLLGHRAGFRISGAVAVSGSTIIGFEAAGDGTPQVASITNSTIIGSRALSNYGPTQVGNVTVIGRNAGQDMSGDDDVVVIGSGALLNASGSDRSVFIGTSCYTSATGSQNSVYIGQSLASANALGDQNVVLGSQALTTPGATGLANSVLLGFSVGNDIGSATGLFLVESTLGTSSGVNRPYLYGSVTNGNLALLSVNDTSTQDENGTRNIPTWGAANGVWTMSGAGTDLGATGDADFMHSWIRNADTALMLQFPTDDTISLLHNGTDSIIANSAGAMRLNGTGSIILSSNSVEGLRLAEDNSGVLQVPSAAVTITAFAGGGQGSAVALIHSYNVITVVATAGDSVRLPDVFSINSLVYIKNDDATEAADVFPASGDDLGQGVNTAVSLAAGQSISFLATVADSTWTPWIVDTVGGSGNVSNTGVPVNNQIAVWTDATTIEGDTGLIWNGTQLIIVETPADLQLVPSIALGDGDTGFYEPVDDFISVTLGGTRHFTFATTSFSSNTGNAWQLVNEAATATNPTLIPHLGDPSTGIGANATGTVSIIANSIECMRFDEAGAVVTNRSFGRIEGVDGNAGLPMYSFTADANTGVFRGGVDILGFAAGGIAGLLLTELNSGVVQAPSASIAITAFAGGGQGSAVALTQSYNVITVVATTGDSVRLPDVFSINSLVYIKNDDAAEAADVFPASGDNLGAGVDTAVSVAAGESISFIATVANSTWTPWIVDTGGGVPSSLVATNAAGPEIEDAAATAANPTLIPNRANNTDGVGSSGAGSVSLIALALEAVRYTGLSSQVLTAPDRQDVVADAVTETQASATIINSSLSRIDSDGGSNTVKFPLVFALDTIMEVTYADPQDSEAGFTLFPGVGDDLGAGVDTLDPDFLFETKHSRKYIATVANSTWAPLPQGATSLISLTSGGPAVLDKPALNGDPVLLPNKDELGTGITMEAADEFQVNVRTGAWLRLQSPTGGQVLEAHDISNVVAFATGGQGSATLMQNSYMRIITVATTGDSVRLPATFKVGCIMEVHNNGANAADIFPSSGDDLGAGTDTAVSLAVEAVTKFRGVVANSTWVQVF